MTKVVSKKILLGMLVANGDCLMATVLAKQIKQDYPNCHLTWAISNLCRQVIEKNPYVDSIWEIELPDKKAGEGEAWFSFVNQANSRKASGEFDEMFFTQIYPSNVHFYDGTTRSTVYNAYPRKITVDATPVLRLQEKEVSRVNDFVTVNKFENFKHVVLFECSSFSGQSFVTLNWATAVSGKLVSLFEDLIIIISTHQKLSISHPRILSGSEISLRENAELTKYCDLLVGCSSGITWIATSDWAKRLPMIQFLRKGIGFTFASVAYDHKYWGLDDSQIIETTNNDISNAVSLITMVLKKGVLEAKLKYHQRLRPRLISMFKYSFMFLRKGKFMKSFSIVKNFLLRNYIRKHRPS